jgi:membrane protease YdiL (CAAX protease family)
MKQAHKKKFIDFKAPGVNEIVLVIILAFCLFPITSITGQLNSGLHLPDWLNPVERWMKEKEDYAAQLINLLISSGTFRIMLFNVLMLAVLPAIGEELLFRGVFQKIFYDLFKSGHLAIWVTAFLFSALHFQFYGFIPRFILGLVFGYLFFWGGTLWLPVISHFVNNAVPVIGAYMQGGDDAKNVSGIFSWGQTFLLPVSIVISFTILQYFRSKHKNKSITKEDMSQHTG